MLIKDKFKKWVDSQKGEFSLHDAKAFYDSVATGDPRFTYSAVYRLLGEFAEFLGYRSLPDGEAARVYRSLSKAKFPALPADLKFVYTGNSNAPRIVMTDVPDDSPSLDRGGVESVIKSMIRSFEDDFEIALSAGKEIGFRQVRCCTSGSTIVVIYASPLDTDDFSHREYHITVAKVEQQGILQLAWSVQASWWWGKMASSPGGEHDAGRLEQIESRDAHRLRPRV